MMNPIVVSMSLSVVFFVVAAASIVIPSAERARSAAITSSNRRLDNGVKGAFAMTENLKIMLGLNMGTKEYTGPTLTKKQCAIKIRSGKNNGSYMRYYSLHEQRSPPMLYTYPGSGNTWSRLLIENAVGVYTGSVYNDHTLVRELPGELKCDPKVSVIKVHPHTHEASRLLNGGFNSDSMKCKKGGIKRFERAVCALYM